jgi:hypothetical protein
MKKFTTASFDLQTQDGQPVYGDLRGNYSLGGTAHDKYGAPHGTINITLREDGNGQRRAKILSEAQAKLGAQLQWVSGPEIHGIKI